MKLGKLSLIAAVALGCAAGANAADTLTEALTNGKLSTTLRAVYADKTNQENAYQNEHIFGMGVEVGYVTDPLYGFRIGVTGQGWTSPYSPSRGAKSYYDKEFYANGFVMSELYLGYGIGKTDIKVGRQYVVTPLVAGNYTRGFKEAFEGVSIVNKDIPGTTLGAGWYYKFQGRSKVAMGGGTAGKTGRAPTFKDRVIMGGLTGPVTMEFDDIYNLYIENKSVPGLKLTGAFARVSDVVYPRNSKKENDVNLYLLEANYRLPVADLLKVGVDAMWKGSRVNNELDKANYDGDMFGFRAGVYDFYGAGLSYAFTRVSDDDAVILGVGNGPGSYTALPIRGPFVYTAYAGMDTHKFTLDYNFSAIGVKGLKASAQYVRGNQSTPSRTAGATRANTHMDVRGYAGVLSYDVEAVKGLSVSATYTDLERLKYNAAGTRTSDQNERELWLQASYKFDLLGTAEKK